MSAQNRQCTFGFKGRNVYYVRDETLFLLRRVVTGLKQRYILVSGFNMPFVFPTSIDI